MEERNGGGGPPYLATGKARPHRKGEEVDDEGVANGHQACRMCRAWRTTALEPQRRRLLDVTREVVTVGAAAGLTMAAAKIGH